MLILVNSRSGLGVNPWFHLLFFTNNSIDPTNDLSEQRFPHLDIPTTHQYLIGITILTFTGMLFDTIIDVWCLMFVCSCIQGPNIGSNPCLTWLSRLWKSVPMTWNQTNTIPTRTHSNITSPSNYVMDSERERERTMIIYTCLSKSSQCIIECSS